MSPVLRDFLQAYADWAYTPDAPNPYEFDHYFGLCNAAIAYGQYHNVDPLPLRRELERAFIADGLDITYPFGEDDFNNSDDLRTCPKRRAWVLAKLEADT